MHTLECTCLHGRDVLTPLPPPQLTGTGTVAALAHGDVRSCGLAADGICSGGLGRQRAPETLVFSGHWTAPTRGGLSCHSLLHAAWTLPPRERRAGSLHALMFYKGGEHLLNLVLVLCFEPLCFPQ